MRNMTGTHREICCFLLTVQTRVFAYSLSLYLKALHPKTVALDCYSPKKNPHSIYFWHASLLRSEGHPYSKGSCKSKENIRTEG